LHGDVDVGGHGRSGHESGGGKQYVFHEFLRFPLMSSEVETSYASLGLARDRSTSLGMSGSGLIRGE
jgi:hypothetical protein